MNYKKWTFQHALFDPLFTDKADIVLSSDLLDSFGVDSLIRDSLMQQMWWAKRNNSK